MAYIDETYEKNIEHSLIALLVPAEQIGPLEKALDAVVSKAVSQHPEVPANAELHGYELNGGSEDWAALKKSPRARIRIYREALAAIAGIEGLAVCRGAVDLKHRAPNDPHKWALTISLERVDAFAQKDDERVIGICDDIGNKLVYQRYFQECRANGTPGYYPKKLESFTDGLHFTPSCFSRPVQAVDMLS